MYHIKCYKDNSQTIGTKHRKQGQQKTNICFWLMSSEVFLSLNTIMDFALCKNELRTIQPVTVTQRPVLTSATPTTN